MANINRRILLAARPKGEPVASDFRFVEEPVPAAVAGQVLLRNLYLSLDPYMRGRMSDAPSYVPPVALGDVMCGATVARVEISHHTEYQPGDLVLAYAGWQDYAVSDGAGLVKLGTMDHPSLALGVLGMPGMTAYVGLLDIGQPKAGETVVVAAATGAVGSVVGQIAKLKGCRVIGIAGGAEKCRFTVDTLGFDACVDHRAADFAARLAQVVPDGIDVYFENVGGAVFDAVLPLLNKFARVPLCGLIAHYNKDGLPPGPDRLALLMGTILKRSIKMQGFIVSDHFAKSAAMQADLNKWVAEGKIHFREDIVQGLERAPQAFFGLLRGENFGKLVVQISVA